MPLSHKQFQNNSGFSLVELSIVLVILGLLTGGILGGQSLIKAAELRSVGQEHEQWQMAVNSFKAKYFEFPGDMTRATQFWGDAGGGGETWDGNGNGKLDFPAAASTEGEIFTFWQHLALAGLVNGEYTGVSGSGSNLDATIGENVPAAKFNSGGWTMSSYAVGESFAAAFYNIDYGNLYQIGGKLTDWETGLPILTQEEAWNIDTKFDDGLPAKGLIIARYWNNLCAEADDGTPSSTDLEASYKLADNTTECALIFRKSF